MPTSPGSLHGTITTIPTSKTAGEITSAGRLVYNVSWDAWRAQGLNNPAHGDLMGRAVTFEERSSKSAKWAKMIQLGSTSAAGPASGASGQGTPAPGAHHLERSTELLGTIKTLPTSKFAGTIQSLEGTTYNWTPHQYRENLSRLANERGLGLDTWVRFGCFSRLDLVGNPILYAINVEPVNDAQSATGHTDGPRGRSQSPRVTLAAAKRSATFPQSGGRSSSPRVTLANRTNSATFPQSGGRSSSGSVPLAAPTTSATFPQSGGRSSSPRVTLANRTNSATFPQSGGRSSSGSVSLAAPTKSATFPYRGRSASRSLSRERRPITRRRTSPGGPTGSVTASSYQHQATGTGVPGPSTQPAQSSPPSGGHIYNATAMQHSGDEALHWGHTDNYGNIWDFGKVDQRRTDGPPIELGDTAEFHWEESNVIRFLRRTGFARWPTQQKTSAKGKEPARGLSRSAGTPSPGGPPAAVYQQIPSAKGKEPARNLPQQQRSGTTQSAQSSSTYTVPEQRLYRSAVKAHPTKKRLYWTYTDTDGILHWLGPVQQPEYDPNFYVEGDAATVSYDVNGRIIQCGNMLTWGIRKQPSA